MSDAELVKLYSGRILALAADIPHLGRLPAPQGSSRHRSALCGSTVTVDVTLKDGRIDGFAQDVKACATGRASAAILGAVALGRSRVELETARNQLRAMLKEAGPVPAAPFDGYEVLLPARDYKNRHASILLVLDAIVDATAQAEQSASA
ncbi:iron-sulfur cluster assembly scaffold protein [Rhodobacter sp.]